jgi:hypothetical protein
MLCVAKGKRDPNTLLKGVGYMLHAQQLAAHQQFMAHSDWAVHIDHCWHLSQPTSNTICNVQQ